MDRKRGQVALEYISVMAFVMLIVIFLVYISQDYSRRVQDTTTMSQVDKVGKLIVDTSEQIFYLGEPSRTTIQVYIPARIENITFAQNETTFMVRTQQGITDISYPARIAVLGNISANLGFRNIKIEARQGYVWVSD